MCMFLPVDIYAGVTSAKKITSHGRDKQEAVKKLRQLANGLEREMDGMLEAVREFENRVSIT